MFRHLQTPVSARRGRLRTGFRNVVYVLVCTGVSTVFIGCQSGAAPEESGPVRILLEEEGLGVVYLPDGCAPVEPSEHPLELTCELIETTETPAGPPGTIRLELGEPREAYVDLADVAALDVLREEHRTLFEALPGGEFLGIGGAVIYGPFGASRYTRGRFQAEDGETLQRIRLFMEHPLENRFVNLVYDHPVVDNTDSAARINNHLLILLESLRTAEDMQAEAEDGATTDEAATY